MLEYVSRFGLFGLGPSRIIRAQQRLASDPLSLANVVRSAGGLIATGKIAPDDQRSSVELEDPWGKYPPSWEPFYCRAGTTVDEAFSHEINRSQMAWQSISAMGALALAVLEGELDGWEICLYCHEPFKPKRRGQRFCSTSHQKKQWENENAKQVRVGNE